MSHRRKNARPTNKHWRNGPHTYDRSPLGMCGEEEEGEGEEEATASNSASGQAIEIPSDIFQDFEQLKHATNLDTTTLMRNLLKDYHRVPEQPTWHRPLIEEDDSKSNPVDDKQVMRDSAEGRLFDMDIVRNSPLMDSGFMEQACDSPIGLPLESDEQPLDLSVVVKSERSTPDYSVCDRKGEKEKVHSLQLKSQLQKTFEVSPRNSPLGLSAPVVMVTSSMMTTDMVLSQVQSQGGLVMASPMPNQCKVVMSSAVPTSGTITVTGDKNECIMMPMQMSMQLPTVTAVEGGQKFITGNFSVETTGGQGGNIVTIPFLQAVAGPMPTAQVQTPQVSQAQPPSTTTQVHQQLQLQQQQQEIAAAQPHVPARRGRKPGSLNKGGKPAKPAKSNEMKVVAENTMFPGVYTSILKLPWSRRSRTKAQPPARPAPPPPQPSMTILPVTSTDATDTTPQLVTTSAQPSTTQSVMMVYPNATISALGKPVRKRGRPPKLPVLSHLLAEKKPKKDNIQTSVATTLSSQSASISADGSMLSILSTHSIGADAATEDDKLKKLQILNGPEHPPGFQQGTFAAPAAPELRTANETVTTKGSNGAIFQEMILSSKSLINIKPRKRQSSNVIKSGENFICTSFRIRPRGSRHKPSVQNNPVPVADPHTLVPVADPPVPSAPSNLDPASPGQQAESSDTANLSPTSTVDDSPLSKNMFHELYHCKVCNEIVPAEDKQSHKQQHVPVKFFCLTCGQEYYSFLQGKDGEDPDAPQSFQCERCSENFNESSVSLSADLELKSKSLWCEICDEQFKCFSEMRKHKREIHGDVKSDIGNYACDECEKMFLTEKSLNLHKDSHSKTVRCILDDCPVMSADEAELDYHVKECHNKKEYSCVYDDCKKKFMKKFHLQEHIRVKHFNIRAYRCSWPGCYKEFAAERHLKVHLLIHKDEKPLKCDFCDYRCRQRNAMNWHMRKHPEAPYRYRKFGMLGCSDD